MSDSIPVAPISASEAAAAIVALINASPRSPLQEEIEQIIAKVEPAGSPFLPPLTLCQSDFTKVQGLVKAVLQHPFANLHPDTPEPPELAQSFHAAVMAEDEQVGHMLEHRTRGPADVLVRAMGFLLASERCHWDEAEQGWCFDIGGNDDTLERGLLLCEAAFIFCGMPGPDEAQKAEILRMRKERGAREKSDRPFSFREVFCVLNGIPGVIAVERTFHDTIDLAPVRAYEAAERAHHATIFRIGATE